MHAATKLPTSGGDFSPVLGISDFPAGGVSQDGWAGQNADLDWWSAAVLFAGDTGPYILATRPPDDLPGLVPYIPFNIHANGGMQLLIQTVTTGGHNAQINAFASPNRIQQDGHYVAPFYVESQVDNQNALTKDLIKRLLAGLL